VLVLLAHGGGAFNIRFFSEMFSGGFVILPAFREFEKFASVCSCTDVVAAQEAVTKFSS
jgi:hypothetical protein